MVETRGMLALAVWDKGELKSFSMMAQIKKILYAFHATPFRFLICQGIFASRILSSQTNNIGLLRAGEKLESNRRW